MQLPILLLACAATFVAVQTPTQPGSPATPAASATKPATAPKAATAAKPGTAAKAGGAPGTAAKAGTSATAAKSAAAAKTGAAAGPKVPPGLPVYTKAVKTSFALRYQDVVVGTGAEAEPLKLYEVKYTGWLAADGKKFDSSDDHPNKEAIKFPQGRGRVIPGWDNGFEGMKVGGKRRLFIPYQMAYGAAGRPPVIPAKADLIFDVELVSVSDIPAPQIAPARQMPGKPPAPPMPGAPTAPGAAGAAASPAAPVTPAAPGAGPAGTPPPPAAAAPAAPAVAPAKPANPAQPQ